MDQNEHLKFPNLFSAASLQDFVDCPRRFQLRHMLKLAWPAIESEPVLEVETLMQLGRQFHRMVQQRQLGIPIEQLQDLIKDNTLQRWWENYLRFESQSVIKGRRFPEVAMSAPFGAARLVAQMDLVLVSDEGRVFIYDWKTSRHRPHRSWLTSRLQSRVYPYLLSQGGAHFTDGLLIEPRQIEMIYWFADFPDQAEKISYSQGQFESDRVFLKGLVEEIINLGRNDFPLTSKIDRCRYCVYRSLCDRGSQAGFLDKEDLYGEINRKPLIDFSKVEEIEF